MKRKGREEKERETERQRGVLHSNTCFYIYYTLFRLEIDIQRERKSRLDMQRKEREARER